MATFIERFDQITAAFPADWDRAQVAVRIEHVRIDYSTHGDWQPAVTPDLPSLNRWMRAGDGWFQEDFRRGSEAGVRRLLEMLDTGSSGQLRLDHVHAKVPPAPEPPEPVEPEIVGRTASGEPVYAA